MSDYKKMMGYGKKKKIVEKKSKPKVNKVLENIKKELKIQEDSLGDAFHRKIKAYQDKIAKEKEAYRKARELQKKKNELKEVGAAPQYKKFVKSIDKQRDKVGKETLKFVDLLRKKGLTDAADDLLDSYKNNVIKFGVEIKKIMRDII
tara:strand:+ start:213 stop:656 length:444 start_codon:yes stop_codon:yes gene_type:complete